MTDHPRKRTYPSHCTKRTVSQTTRRIQRWLAGALGTLTESGGPVMVSHVVPR